MLLASVSSVGIPVRRERLVNRFPAQPGFARKARRSHSARDIPKRCSDKAGASVFQHRFQIGNVLLAGFEMVLRVEFGGFHLVLLRQSLGDCLTSSMCTEIHSSG